MKISITLKGIIYFKKKKIAGTVPSRDFSNHKKQMAAALGQVKVVSQIIISLKNQRQRKALLIPFKQNHDKEAIMNGLLCESMLLYSTIICYITTKY